MRTENEELQELKKQNQELMDTIKKQQEDLAKVMESRSPAAPQLDSIKEAKSYLTQKGYQEGTKAFADQLVKLGREQDFTARGLWDQHAQTQ